MEGDIRMPVRGKSKLFIVLALVVLLVSSIPVAAIASDAESQPLTEESGEIAYASLDEAQQTAYKRFQAGIENIETTGNFVPIIMFDFGVHMEELQIVQFAYMSDHPDKFWASYYTGCTTPNESTGLYTGLTASYTVPLDKLTSMIKDLNNAVSSIDKSSGSMGDRMKYLHDTVNNTTSYTEDAATYPNCGNAYGVFVDHKSKCDGYSLAFALLCHRESIPCVVEIGYITSEGKTDGGHAWNIAKIDNAWYYLDLTWDDGNYDRRYEYFLIGSQTGTYTGSFASTRTIYYDYYIDVSKDKYNYEPYGFLEKNKAVIAVIAAIVIIVIFFVIYFLHRKNQQKKLQEAANNMIASGNMCPQCGCRIPKDQDFCPACGKKAVGKEDEKRPPQQ